MLQGLFQFPACLIKDKYFAVFSPAYDPLPMFGKRHLLGVSPGGLRIIRSDARPIIHAMQTISSDGVVDDEVSASMVHGCAATKGTVSY
jgi:hypothetical protein